MNRGDRRRWGIGILSELDEEIERLYGPLKEAEVAKKLWIVAIKTEALVLADTADDARDFASEILGDLYLNDATRVSPFVDCVPAGWGGASLVYHGGHSYISVDDALAMVRETA